MQVRRVLAAAAGVIILSSTVLAGTAGASPTKKYVYAVASSSDSSTCGGNWATDHYRRTYTVTKQQNIDGTYRVIESYKGTFTTIAGPSPESCEAGSNNTVSGGLTGKLVGTATLKITNGVYSSGETVNCVDTDTAPPDNVHGCGTADFIKAAFGAGATYDYIDYGFAYTIKKSQGCAVNWENAQTGNGGDIATTCIA